MSRRHKQGAEHALGGIAYHVITRLIAGGNLSQEGIVCKGP